MSIGRPMKTSGQTARSALLDAFAELVLSRRYQEVGVGLIARKAGVARSTFYYHFKAKDELLLQNLKPMMSALAGFASAAQAPKDIEDWAAHIWQHRARARRLLEGPTGRKLADALALELQPSLRAALDDRSDRGSIALLADQIAGATHGLLRGWISGHAAATPAEIAQMVWSGAKAQVQARAEMAPPVGIAPREFGEGPVGGQGRLTTEAV